METPIEIETGPNPQASVIVLHGLGASGDDFVPVCQQLELDAVGPVPRAAARTDAPRNEYDLAEICRWLRVFLERFFANQFKRSALPDGPKVGSGGSLSPRGDWRAPSDASAKAWLEELDEYEARVLDVP